MAYPLFIKSRAGSASNDAFKGHNEKQLQPSRYRSCPDDDRLSSGERAVMPLSLPISIRLVNAYQIIGMIDDINPERAGLKFAGYEVLGGRETLGSLWERQVRTMIVGFGNCRGRLQVARFLRERGFLLATAVHPRATVAADLAAGVRVGSSRRSDFRKLSSSAYTKVHPIWPAPLYRRGGVERVWGLAARTSNINH